MKSLFLIVNLLGLMVNIQMTKKPPEIEHISLSTIQFFDLYKNNLTKGMKLAVKFQTNISYDINLSISLQVSPPYHN